ncbi:MAG: LacI family transcriptional regulator [Spirochaetaceae bacterium]|jgi:LacI family transcriptional regulator|nr:LacI family transcriptional regulator [Spirochaetaceae bacterium]
MVNIKDIAKQAGMSPSTVSRVINGKKHVNSVKRKQILKLIEETGYVPNKAARSMVLRRSFTVGIVIPDTFNMFQRQLFSIIERHLDSFGYHTLFFFVTFDDQSEDACLNRLKAEKVDGVIMLHEIKNPAFYDYITAAALPIVTATFRYPGFSAIHVNEEQASKDAVMHLINLGHSRILMISGDGFTFGRQRAEGFFQALTEASISWEENRVVFVPHYTAEFGMYGMRELFLREQRNFTALFAATDELAIGAIRVLNDEGIRVPQDVSVVGFDDIEIAEYMYPRLTTISQPLSDMGEKTALTLHRQITGGKGGGKEQILPYKLIIRESTRALAR